MRQLTILAVALVLFVVTEGGGGHRRIFRRPGGGHRWNNHHSSEDDRSGSWGEHDWSDDWSNDQADESDRSNDWSDDWSRETDNWQDEEDYGDSAWFGSLTTAVEQRLKESPLYPYNNLMKDTRLENGRKPDKIKMTTRIAIGAGAGVTAVVVLIVAVLACCVAKKSKAQSTSQSTYAVKDSTKTSPPPYIPQFMPVTSEKVPLGDGFTGGRVEQVAGVDNHSYQDVSLPTYSSLDLKQDGQTVPVPDVPGVHHM